MPVGVKLEGSADLFKTLGGAEHDFRQAWHRALPRLSEPTRSTAEHHALTEIRRMPHSPEWAAMRTVIGVVVAYIVPARKGARGRGSRARPNLADLFQERALEPAEEENEKRFDRDAQALLDKLVTKWNEPGVPHG